MYLFFFAGLSKEAQNLSPISGMVHANTPASWIPGPKFVCVFFSIAVGGPL